MVIIIFNGILFFRDGDMGHIGGSRGSTVPTRAGKAVSEFMTKHNMLEVNLLESATRLVNTFVSHNGRSTLDYVMIPKCMEGNVLSSCTGRNEGENTSDHFPIEVILEDRMLPRTVNTAKRAPRLKWKKVGEGR